MRPPEKAVWQDTIVVALATAVMVFICVQFDLSEALRRWAAPWERFQLDELPAVLVVVAVGLAWFAARRYIEAGRELERREVAEAQLEAALTDNRRLAQQYVRLQEAERKSLARELHDELGQYLNVIKLDAVGIRDAQHRDAALFRERALAIVVNCDHIHAALAALLRQLRPVGLDDLGLGAALEHCVDTWRPRLPDVKLDLTVTGEFADLGETLKLTAYRVIQESLSNIAKHAGARQVRLQLDRARSGSTGAELISITVADDGAGANPDAQTRGLGLIGMRERVAALGGRLEITSAPGRGFELKAQIPVDLTMEVMHP
jgi:two-component system, NarL family, sensor histidine kinase UhpB